MDLVIRADAAVIVPFDVEVLARTRIAPDARQVFVVDAADITALRVQAYPDGGIARARAFGRPTERGVAPAAIDVGGVGMSVLMTECRGLWRRTLLIDSDGLHATGTGVAWLQGITAYVDTRGFAGRLSQHGDVFEWQRLIDIEPPGPFPDAGRMRWEAGALIEVGVHEDYVEYWVRQDVPAAPCWALFAEDAILLRAGAQFGWADRSGVVLDTIGGPRWTAIAPHVDGGDLVANGVRWSIEDNEGDVDL